MPRVAGVRVVSPLLVLLAVLGLLGLRMMGSAETRWDDLSQREGQRVRLEGVVRDVRSVNDGYRFQLVGGGKVVDATLPEPPVGVIELDGVLGRRAGALHVWGTAWRPANGSAPPTDLASLAESPEVHLHQLIAVSGWFEKGTLRDGEGHRIQAKGNWTAGAQTAKAMLDYAPSCACYVLEWVSPWRGTGS